MRKGWTMLTLASLGLTTGVGWGQAPQELRESATIRVAPKESVQAIPEPVKCDADSNVFYRVYQDKADITSYPVQRISRDGKAFVFPAPHPEGKARALIDFAPSGNGALTLLTSDYGTTYYLDFLADNGDLNSESKLPAGIRPLQLAVSSPPSREIFISGLRTTAGPEKSESIPFAGIFDPGGALQREVSASESQGGKTIKGHYDRVLDLSSAQSSGSGNFILARLPSDGPIYVISPGGQELNELRPTVSEGYSLSSVKVDGEIVAALLIKKVPNGNEISDIVIWLWDADTGKPIGEFREPSPELGASLACYQGGTFTFLSPDPDSGELRLVRAVAK